MGRQAAREQAPPGACPAGVLGLRLRQQHPLARTRARAHPHSQTGVLTLPLLLLPAAVQTLDKMDVFAGAGGLAYMGEQPLGRAAVRTRWAVDCEPDMGATFKANFQGTHVSTGASAWGAGGAGLRAAGTRVARALAPTCAARPRQHLAALACAPPQPVPR